MKILLSLLLLTSATLLPAAERPNVLLIFADDIGYEVLNRYGGRELGREASLQNFVHYMDKLVGKLPDEFESLGIRDNTYVLFMGDNGTWEPDFSNPKAGQPDEQNHTRHTTAGPVNGGKNDLNDGGSHVPLLVWGPPAVPRDAVCDELVDIVDLFPTLCGLTGTEIPSSIAIDGRSIAAQIHGKPGIPREWVHHALSARHDGETLFDGNSRLFRNNGKLIDARALPMENPADMKDPDAIAAKARLTAVFKEITIDGPRPPEPFSTSPGKAHTHQPATR